mmetsp:Transcript_17021/g.27668  ORF Transcript_17021/g.27668 Transcript_17021/m.27668 type:complete len:187 (-) Transcript_17021:157-717(-)
MDLEILYYSVLVGVVVVLGSVAIISLARTATRNAFEMFKLAIIEAMTEILSPVLREALIATFEDPRLAAALTATMQRVMEKQEMRNATKNFATNFAEEAARSKHLNREAAKFTGSLVSEMIYLMKNRVADAATGIPLLETAVNKCICKGSNSNSSEDQKAAQSMSDIDVPERKDRDGASPGEERSQ